MKKVIIILLGAILCYAGLVFVLRMTGITRAYKITSESNEPNLNPGDLIYMSILKKPGHFDFISYHQDAGGSWNEGIWFMRVCGLPGDKIQVVNGVLFVNDYNADKLLNLKNEYSIKRQELAKLPDDYFDTREGDVVDNGSDPVHILLETSVFKSKGLSGELILGNEPDDEIRNAFQRPWNADNFGPVTVPSDHYFVMGDNRHRAPDSRYTGFIDKKSWLGTLWFKLK